MSGATLDPRLQPARQAPKKAFQLSWADPRFRNIVWQVLVIGTVAAIVWYLVDNTQRNLTSRRIATGFGFLDRTAGIPIGEHMISYDPAVNTYGRALWIGVLNTLKVAVVGIFLATIWGTLLGVARLSNNWMIARLSAVYVEVVRDIPLLLQLLFWYAALQGLPDLKDAMNPITGFYFFKRGIVIPLIEWEMPYWWALGAMLLGLIGTIVWSKQATKKQNETGIRPKVWPVAVVLMIAVPVAVWAALGAPFQVEMPVKGRFNIQGGGTLSPEYAALTLGLVVYTSAYIAEIVRSGILAVASGQWEAAGALGLRSGPVLRKIVLPQAMRVIIPPMTSQFLNLTKNSSLAVAIGYQDVVSLANTTLNQTGQAIEGIAVIMVVYLTISLSISLFMNWYNARIALVER